MLLVGSGVLIKCFARVRGVVRGFDTAQRIGFRVQVMHARYPARADQLAFYDRLREALRAVPGVRDVAIVRGLPLVGGVGTEGMALEGRAPSPDGRHPAFDFQVASDGYFELMGIPVVAGRSFRPSDDTNAPAVVLINAAAARAYFPGESAVGKRGRILFAPADWPPVTIVGVVGDVRQRALDADPRPELYLPPPQVPPGFPDELMQSLALALRVELPLERLAPAIRRVVADLDPAVPIEGLATLDGAVSSDLATERFSTLLLALFAAVALAIAAAGVYGVMACSVAQRTREIGIRMALGAAPGQVLRAVLGSTLGLTAAGAAAGLAAAAFATRALESMVFEVGVRDPLVFAASAAALVAVALVAALLPARRAAAVEPVNTLRAE
jgi:putative ABC transport system permease protein